jgi:Tol biopolymer transport system component
LQGGTAHLLVSHANHESRPLYSPDGRYLAFTSTRTGNGDIYVMEIESGSVKRLTYDDGIDEVSAWSRDGKYIYFSSGSQEISGLNDVFRIAVTGGTPMPVADERYTNEFFAVPSPDGSNLAFNARGVASRQWWRNGHSHLDESQIWLRNEAKQVSYKPVTEGGAKELWPMWSKDGSTIYYISDRDGKQNLWSRSLSGTAKQLTSFKDGRVLWPSISYDGKTIVFERDFTIWKYDIASNQAMPVSISKRGAAAGPATQHLKLTSQFDDLMLSPDGKKVAFVAHGEVFAASATDGGDAMRITNTVENETNLAWSPDSRRMVYVSNREDAAHLYIYDFATRNETKLTSADTDDALPVFSPDGKFIAFQRDGKELRVLEVASKKETVLFKGYLGRPRFDSKGSIIWSPDSKWIAFASSGVKNFRNVSWFLLQAVKQNLLVF